MSGPTCTNQSESVCVDCALGTRLMCRYEFRDTLHFFAIILPFFVVSIGGMIATGFGWWLFGWLGYMLFFFFIWEARVLCSHCPYWAEEGHILHCHANYGVIKIWHYRPGPMSRFEHAQFIVGALIFLLSPIVFILVGGQYLLAGIALAGAGSFGYLLYHKICSRCVNFSYPLNNVPSEVKERYVVQNWELLLRFGDVIELNEYVDGVFTLKVLLLFLTHLVDDEERMFWIWIIISCHKALQSFMVLGLKGSNSLRTYTDKSAREWNEAYEENDFADFKAGDIRLDNFIGLYKKIQNEEMKLYTNSKVFSPSYTQDSSVYELNHLRNSFIHFTPKSWIFGIDGFPQIIYDSIMIIRFIAFESNNVIFYEEDDKKELRALVDKLTEKLIKHFPIQIIQK